MGLRRKARECALQILYQWDISGHVINLETVGQDMHYPANVLQFAKELINGTLDNLGEIDHVISKASDHWDLIRMSYIDRNILRLAVCEIMFRDDIPYKVSINEAIELGKKFGSDQSSNFINGILDNIGLKPDKNMQNKG